MARSRRQWGSVRQVRKNARWQARYLDPDTFRLVPAPSTFATKADADRWLANKRSELDRGVLIDEREGSRPLSHWWPGYLKSVAALRTSTVTSYEAAWRLRIEPRFGATPVRRIRVSQVGDWLADLVASGVSAAKAIEAYGVLKRVIDRAVRDRALYANPCALRSTPLPRSMPRVRPVLTPAQVEQLANAMKSPMDATLVRVLAYGGLRIGEALALRRKDFDPDLNTLRVHSSVRDVAGHLEVGATKTYEARTVTLPGSLVRELAAQHGDDMEALIFPGHLGAHRRYRNFRRDAWDPAVDATGLAVTPHDLRATCASLLVDAGASIKDVQAQLGHADISTTMNLYARVRPGRAADLAQRLDALIAES